MALKKSENSQEKNEIAISKKSRKEFLTRVSSSLFFIPLILLFVFGSFDVALFLCAITYGAMLYEIFSVKSESQQNTKILALGALCGLIGVAAFAFCRKYFGVIGCGFLICIASFADIGAYLSGKTFQGPKLCPSISPGKTWAGFFGGIFISNLVAYCFSKIFSDYGGVFSFFPQHDIEVFALTQILIFSAIAGDLLESYFKRKIGVKDMGNLFPGHGGVWDRIDSLMLASVVMAALGIFLGVTG